MLFKTLLWCMRFIRFSNSSISCCTPVISSSIFEMISFITSLFGTFSPVYIITFTQTHLFCVCYKDTDLTASTIPYPYQSLVLNPPFSLRILCAVVCILILTLTFVIPGSADIIRAATPVT